MILIFVTFPRSSGSHFKDILKCFKYNKNVIVEKPPVLKVSELLKLNKIAKKEIKVLCNLSK